MICATFSKGCSDGKSFKGPNFSDVSPGGTGPFFATVFKQAYAKAKDKTDEAHNSSAATS